MQHPESKGQDMESEQPGALVELTRCQIGPVFWWSQPDVRMVQYSGGAGPMSKWSITPVEQDPSGADTPVELVLGRLLGFGHVW
jgi:hypothetical protein